MKTKIVKAKLILNKETIANLSNETMPGILGGVAKSVGDCTVTHSVAICTSFSCPVATAYPAHTCGWCG